MDVLCLCEWRCASSSSIAQCLVSKRWHVDPTRVKHERLPGFNIGLPCRGSKTAITGIPDVNLRCRHQGAFHIYIYVCVCVCICICICIYN